jgi:hypothetical protein
VLEVIPFERLDELPFPAEEFSGALLILPVSAPLWWCLVLFDPRGAWMQGPATIRHHWLRWELGWQVGLRAD